MANILIYVLLFAFGAPANLSVLLAMVRKKRPLRSKITRLLLNLSVADIIVTWIMIPTEIVWSITNKWLFGDAMCRIIQVFRALGPYLSSAILISISVDRYFAIVFPLHFPSTNKRINWMLFLSWAISIMLSLPQGFVFRVKHHPQDPDFTQCISLDFFAKEWQEKAYNLFVLIPLYFGPLVIIVWCYIHIYFAARHRTADPALNPDMEMECSEKKNSPVRCTQTTEVIDHLDEPDASPSTAHIMAKVDSCQPNVRFMSKVEHARRQVLKITIKVVLAFVICWTPYVLMTLWWQLHQPSAERVDPVLRNFLFLFAVSNSVVNPYLYGGFRSPFSWS
ncbi:Gonadotropin-releasing hormone II receptor [Halotydeus destructor]|nr:Gonadotropin-releasing hormone II receptor [Halotydeus destructor]